MAIPVQRRRLPIAKVDDNMPQRKSKEVTERLKFAARNLDIIRGRKKEEVNLDELADLFSDTGLSKSTQEEGKFEFPDFELSDVASLSDKYDEDYYRKFSPQPPASSGVNAAAGKGPKPGSKFAAAQELKARQQEAAEKAAAQASSSAAAPAGNGSPAANGAAPVAAEGASGNAASAALPQGAKVQRPTEGQAAPVAAASNGSSGPAAEPIASPFASSASPASPFGDAGGPVSPFGSELRTLSPSYKPTYEPAGLSPKGVEQAPASKEDDMTVYQEIVQKFKTLDWESLIFSISFFSVVSLIFFTFSVVWSVGGVNTTYAEY